LKYLGVGEIANQFEYLKNKLQKEGIFDAIHKKPLPKFVQNIAVISAKNSAAIEDIFTTLKGTIVKKTYFIPAIMQGATCISSVISALKIAEKLPVEAILIARGGGSLEDLSQFNSEELARMVFAAKIPIISAIGHEIDFTILDFVADFRAPTPTYGAQMISPQKIEVFHKIRAMESVISQKTQFEIAQFRNKVENIEYKMRNLIDNGLQNAKRRFENAENALNIRHFLLKLMEYRNRILILEQKIEQINPKKVLKIGFVMLKSGDVFENNPQTLPENFEIITHFGNFPAKKRNP
jgi:exodeoxyribonuclease VII large subunit